MVGIRICKEKFDNERDFQRKENCNWLGFCQREENLRLPSAHMELCWNGLARVQVCQGLLRPSETGGLRGCGGNGWHAHRLPSHMEWWKTSPRNLCWIRCRAWQLPEGRALQGSARQSTSLGSRAHWPSLRIGRSRSRWRSSRQGGYDETQPERNIKALWWAGWEGLRFQACSRRERLLRRLWRFHKLSSGLQQKAK